MEKCPVPHRKRLMMLFRRTKCGRNRSFLCTRQNRRALTSIVSIKGFPTVLSGQSEKPQQLCERTLRRKLPVGKNKIARNDQLNLSARAGGVETQLGSDAVGPLLHARNPKVPLFPLDDDLLIDADPVVSNPDDKIACITQFNIDSRTPRVQAGIAHRLITD